MCVCVFPYILYIIYFVMYFTSENVYAGDLGAAPGRYHRDCRENCHFLLSYHSHTNDVCNTFRLVLHCPTFLRITCLNVTKNTTLIRFASFVKVY